MYISSTLLMQTVCICTINRDQLLVKLSIIHTSLVKFHNMLVQTYKIIKDIIVMLSNGFVMIEQFSKSDNIHVWIGKTKTMFLMYGGGIKTAKTQHQC